MKNHPIETTTPPEISSPSPLAKRISAAPQMHDNNNPLWQGPCASGPLGGITQSMLSRFLSCRERFRLKYVCGLEPHDKWNHRLGYGNMWHVCEEAIARGDNWEGSLKVHTVHQGIKYPTQQDEIIKWYNVCTVQFPEYVKYWKSHPDVLNCTPLLQEQVFDVPYNLPSGRVVRLRGKWDSVDLIDNEEGMPSHHRGIYLQENKTKGDVDKIQIERQLKFDLQSMLYLIALGYKPSCEDTPPMYYRHGGGNNLKVGEYPIKGVRYNVVRRPLSGGKGNISPHKAKYTKTKMTPAETEEQFYERLRKDYIAAEPDYWFFRIKVEITDRDIQTFRKTCLDPLLEQLCWWYDECNGVPDPTVWQEYGRPPMNYRTPFGTYNALSEGGATEYDAYMATGSEIGLRRIDSLFPELQ